ncbi:MAG: hypothetical protein U0636_11195 [Phycisphaerales bacterium]
MQRIRPALAWAVSEELVPAASAQYIHNLIVGLEIMMLGKLRKTLPTNRDFKRACSAFAFLLAGQANSVIAAQLGVVLQ